MSSSGLYIDHPLQGPGQLGTQCEIPKDGKATGHRILHMKPTSRVNNQCHILQHSEIQCDRDRDIDHGDTPAISDAAVGAENGSNGKSGTFPCNHKGSASSETPNATTLKDGTISRRSGR